MIGSQTIRTAIFGVRNIEKTKEGHIGRSAVLVGQTKSVFDAIKGLDGKIANSARSASSAFHAACKNDALLEGAYKVADKCSLNINPLIWASAGIDVLLADDKEEALFHNAAGIGTMRLTERYMKKNLDNQVEKCVDFLKNSKFAKKDSIKNLAGKINKNLASSNNKALKYIGKGGGMNILKGVLYVLGSCVAYDIGLKFGDMLLEKKRKS